MVVVGFFEGPLDVDNFVTANVLANCSPEEKARYISAVQDMRLEFDRMMSRFLRKVSGKEVPSGNTSHPCRKSVRLQNKKDTSGCVDSDESSGEEYSPTRDDNGRQSEDVSMEECDKDDETPYPARVQRLSHESVEENSQEAEGGPITEADIPTSEGNARGLPELASSQQEGPCKSDGETKDVASNGCPSAGDDFLAFDCNLDSQSTAEECNAEDNISRYAELMVKLSISAKKEEQKHLKDGDKEFNGSELPASKQVSSLKRKKSVSFADEEMHNSQKLEGKQDGVTIAKEVTPPGQSTKEIPSTRPQTRSITSSPKTSPRQSAEEILSMRPQTRSVAAVPQGSNCLINVHGKDVNFTGTKLVFGSPDLRKDMDAGQSSLEVPSFDLGFDLTPPKKYGSRDKIAGSSGVRLEQSADQVGLQTAESSKYLEHYQGLTQEDYDLIAAEAGEELFPHGEQLTVQCDDTAKGPEYKDALEDSTTPVPEAHRRRVVNATKFQKSPFIDYTSKKQFNVSRATNELYNHVCRHGWRSRSTIKGRKIIDYGDSFILMGDLADSVRPGRQLMNTTAEIGIHIIIQENSNLRKKIMPLRISFYLMHERLENKLMKRIFSIDAEHRLDHKDLILFPVLQNLSDDKDDLSSHYFVFALNLKAERFEVFDSMRNETSELLMDGCNDLMTAIKLLWSKEMGVSNINISMYPLKYIEVPQQGNLYDCGFVMLKFLKLWDGRKMEWFTQDDLPNIRKLYTQKWLHWGQNKVVWQDKLYK